MNGLLPLPPQTTVNRILCVECPPVLVQLGTVDRSGRCHHHDALHIAVIHHRGTSAGRCGRHQDQYSCHTGRRDAVRIGSDAATEDALRSSRPNPSTLSLPPHGTPHPRPHTSPPRAGTVGHTTVKPPRRDPGTRHDHRPRSLRSVVTRYGQLESPDCEATLSISVRSAQSTLHQEDDQRPGREPSTTGRPMRRTH